VEVLLDRGEALMSDFLVIDEMQDIAREPFLDVLDLMVKGGLADGRVLIFGDFERQAIFETEDGRELLRKRIPGSRHTGSLPTAATCRASATS